MELKPDPSWLAWVTPERFPMLVSMYCLFRLERFQVRTMVILNLIAQKSGIKIESKGDDA